MVRQGILITFALVMIVGTVSAGPIGDVVVVYERRSETNRHAIEFIQDYFRANGAQYRVRALSVQDTDNFQPKEYLAAIVLNTGRQDGNTPDLAAFTDRWGATLPVVAVNLRSGRRSTAIETSGVDAVTAATRWQDRSFFGGTNDIYDMHEAWANFVLSAIDEQIQVN